MKLLALSFALVLVPVSLVQAKTLWECPYGNFIMDRQGRCIDLTYIVTGQEPVRVVNPESPGAKFFPEWMISTDPRYNAQKRAAITEDFDTGLVFKNRYVQARYDRVNGETVYLTIDCFSGWYATVKTPPDRPISLEYRPPIGNDIQVAAHRLMCRTSDILPRF